MIKRQFAKDFSHTERRSVLNQKITTLQEDEEDYSTAPTIKHTNQILLSSVSSLVGISFESKFQSILNPKQCCVDGGK